MRRTNETDDHVVDLIDTTEMYLRTIYELEEEGINPLRARIAERLSQSGPTVSQTVARMERDGLLRVEGDRHIELSERGRTLATRVMRKHRLAERLLIDVIGLDWEDVHAEACRWEHVMSEAVERRLLHWYFDQYVRHLPRSHVLRYEDIVASGGHALEVITPAATDLAVPLTSRNANPAYGDGALERIAPRLLEYDGAFWSFYDRDDARRLISTASPAGAP